MSTGTSHATCPNCGIIHAGECWSRSRLDARPLMPGEAAPALLPMGCICPAGANLECQSQFCPRKEMKMVVTTSDAGFAVGGGE